MYSRRVPLLASFVMATQKEMKDTAWKAEPETLLELLDSSSRSTSYKTTLSPAVTKHFSSRAEGTHPPCCLVIATKGHSRRRHRNVHMQNGPPRSRKGHAVFEFCEALCCYIGFMLWANVDVPTSRLNTICNFAASTRVRLSKIGVLHDSLPLVQRSWPRSRKPDRCYAPLRTGSMCFGVTRPHTAAATTLRVCMMLSTPRLLQCWTFFATE